uniref:peptidylprolyl isomerase n=1 Tax=Nothoprocta perdicaria TaxID=30464 RepID=A0A8C6ZSC6_NOTPE
CGTAGMARALGLALLLLPPLCALAARDEVSIEVLHVPEPCGPRSKKGDLLNAHYDGYLASDGSRFYCSRTQNEGHPKWFVLGVGQVIKGLDIAMMNMCPGEKRKVTIPPSLAYGQQGYGKKTNQNNPKFYYFFPATFLSSVSAYSCMLGKMSA